MRGTSKRLRIAISFLFLIQQIAIAPFPALAVGEIELEPTSENSVIASTPYDNNAPSEEPPDPLNQPETLIDFLADTTSLKTAEEEFAGTGAALSGTAGTVDASDYTIWRKNQGWQSTGPGDTNPGDFNKDGKVDNADYNFWRSRFGTTVTTSFRAMDVFEWINSQHKSISGTFEMAVGAPAGTYTYLLVDPPDHGTLQINGANYTYTPTLGYY